MIGEFFGTDCFIIWIKEVAKCIHPFLFAAMQCVIRSEMCFCEVFCEIFGCGFLFAIQITLSYLEQCNLIGKRFPLPLELCGFRFFR